MTYTEFLNTVIANEITDETIDKANELLAAHRKGLDKRNATVAAKREEVNAPIREAIVANLTDAPAPATASELAEAIGGVTFQKVTAVIKGMDNIEVVETKNKGRVVKAYKLV